MSVLRTTVLLAGALLVVSAPAEASETVAERLGRSLGQLDRGRGDAVAQVLALWEAQALSSLVPGGVARTESALERLTRSRDPLIRAEAHLTLGKSLVESGRPRAEPFVAAGVPTRGVVLGPFAGPSPGDRPAPRQGEQRDHRYQGKHGATDWRPFVMGASATIPLDDFLPSQGDAHAYIGFAFETAGAEVRFILGSNGPMVARLDGRPLAEFTGERELRDWQDHRVLRLDAGTHWLEIGVGHRSAAPQLSVRVLYADGRPIGRFQEIDQPPERLAGWSSPRRARPGLAGRAKSPRQIAELTAWIDPQPPAERNAARLLEALIAVRAERRAPASELADLHYLLGRAERTDISRATAAFETADRLAGGHAQALAALIDLAERSGLSARADRLTHRLASLDPGHPAAIGQQMVRRFRLADALAALPLMPDDLPNNARLASLEATLAQDAGDYARAGHAYARLAMARHGAPEVVQRAVQSLLRAARPGEANDVLTTALALRPMSGDLLILQGRTRATVEPDLGPVIDELERYLAFHHQSPHFEELRGRLLLLAGERGRAIAAFDRALELAPQNRDLADYRRALVTERGHGERWAEPVESLLARSRAAPRQPVGAITLLEKSVTEVFDSGLASQFRQLAIRIDRQSAIERFTDMLFAFTPGEDRLEVLEAEIIRVDGAGEGSEVSRIRPRTVADRYQRGKSEGVYTLTAYKVIEFPTLAVGDIVHVQLRKDEIGSRNLFGDFFGLVYPMSSEFPKAHAEVIVIAPTTRRLYHSTARLPPPEVSVEGDTQRLVFSADDLPALTIEPSMPGYGDIGAWISVSTFASWQELADWYRELVRTQLEVPPDLAQVARGLVAGLDGVEDQVAAIHRWVVTRTRYVGIEFGIHGFKPYKMAEVVQRGYGDCKDKAALMVSMLRVVGIDAEFVLVRTRDLGALEGTPATLWAFNHAIAYVPALDLYLDGTAETSGLRELPDLDQGAQVLRIDLYSRAPPTLAYVPVQPPLENKVIASARFVLDAGGDATVELSETIHGTSAGRLRARLQDKSRRDAMIAEIIAAQHPGSTLDEAGFDNLDALGQPVTIRARVRLPRLGIKSGEVLEVPLVLEPGRRLVETAPLTARKQPLVLRQTELETTVETYVLPPGAELIELPAPVDVHSPFGRWTMQTRAEDGAVVVTSHWEISETRIAPGEYPAFRRFLEDVAKSEGVRLRMRVPISPGG